MAKLVLSPFIGAILDGLISEVLGELRLYWGRHEDMENLGTTLSTILGVLADAEEKQPIEFEVGVKVWLTQLEDAVYEAEDILDLCRSEGLRRKMLQNKRSQFENYFSASNPILLDKYMAPKVKDIRQRLDEIIQVRENFGLNAMRRVMKVINGEEMDSSVNESAVKEREEQNKTVEKLHDIGKEGKVWIISVVGMGELGKITLAQLIYNDASLKKLIRKIMNSVVLMAINDPNNMKLL